MEFFANPVVAAIGLLGILILVHEAGHFLVGRVLGIGVETFSVGFGPKIFSIRRTGTTYQLCLIPLGGFVKFYGSVPTEDVPDIARGKEFWRAKPWVRFLTVAAGPVANILLAMLAYFSLATAGIPYIESTIGFIRADSPAYEAGLQPGDRILSIGGRSVDTWAEMERIISRSPKQNLLMEAERSGVTRTVEIKPASESGFLDGEKKPVGRIGIAAVRVLPIIAVVDRTSPAAQAGFRTGDRVVAVSTSADSKIEVQYYDQLVDFIFGALSSGQSDISLWLSSSSEEVAESELLLPLTGLSVETKDLTKALGLRDGQLLIADPQRYKDQLRGGDLIVAVNEKPILSQFDLAEFLRDYREPTLKLSLVREGEYLDLPIQLEPITVDLPEGTETRYRMLVEFREAYQAPPVHYHQYGFGEAISYGVSETWAQSKMLFSILGRLITGNISLATMGGPILIAKVAGDAAKQGWQTFVNTLALISINLAVVNLVPIPVLDGGQIVLILTEAVKRRPLSMRSIENYQRLGFVMVMALMVLVFYNDLNRFWSRMVQGLMGIGE
jgi:regulator of sigma E protease